MRQSIYNHVISLTAFCPKIAVMVVFSNSSSAVWFIRFQSETSIFKFLRRSVDRRNSQKLKRFRQQFFLRNADYEILRPGSDAVLHTSRIEFNELSSCEVWRLNQFETADIIRIGLAVLHAWLSRESERLWTGFDSDAALHISRTKYIN